MLIWKGLTVGCQGWIYPHLLVDDLTGFYYCLGRRPSGELVIYESMNKGNNWRTRRWKKRSRRSLG